MYVRTNIQVPTAFFPWYMDGIVHIYICMDTCCLRADISKPLPPPPFKSHVSNYLHIIPYSRRRFRVGNFVSKQQEKTIKKKKEICFLKKKLLNNVLAKSVFY